MTVDWEAVFRDDGPMYVTFESGGLAASVEWDGRGRGYVNRHDGHGPRREPRLDAPSLEVRTVIRTALAQGDPSGALEWVWTG